MEIAGERLAGRRRGRRGWIALERLPAELAPIAGLPLVIWLALASGFLRYAGAVWDVSWHRTVVRDTFWSPPHVALYAGVGLSLLAALWALSESSRSARPVSWPAWRIGRLVLPAAYLLVLIGGVITALSAPVDHLWHALFGRDVDIWSPPHLAAISGTAVSTVGWIMALLPWLGGAPSGLSLAEGLGARAGPLRGAERRPRPAAPEVVYWIFLGFLLYTGWFSLNWYHMSAATRDVLLYPSLAGLVLLPVLVASSLAGPRRWSATAAATAFVVLAVLPIVVFAPVGWRAPAFPPLLIVPAAALDVLRRRAGGDVARVGIAGAGIAMAVGVIFALLFLAVEFIRILAPAPGPPPSALEALVVRPHLMAAAERPWTLPSIATALPIVLLANAVGGVLGWLLGLAFARARLPEDTEQAGVDRGELGPSTLAPEQAGGAAPLEEPSRQMSLMNRPGSAAPIEDRSLSPGRTRSPRG